MRVVVDTNIVISAIFFGGKPTDIINHGIQGTFSLIVTSSILHEYAVTIDNFDNNPDGEAASLLALIISKATAIEPIRLLKTPCRDPDDVKFLEAALSAKADFIVSGDKDLLVLKEFRGTKILKASEFLTLLQQL